MGKGAQALMGWCTGLGAYHLASVHSNASHHLATKGLMSPSRRLHCSFSFAQPLPFDIPSF